MKTSIDFLPAHKQEQLQSIRDYIVAQIDPEMIILFGSHARGEWVEDEYTEDGITYQYRSDFDILVITERSPDNAARSRWHQTEKDLVHRFRDTPVSLILEGIRDVNREMRRNSYFYTDIYKEGIALYDNKRFRINPPSILSEAETLAKAKEDFDYWFGSANGFYKQYIYALGENDLKIAAFLLHQTVERYYVALILVFTGYRPKTHSLKELGEQAQRIHERFKVIFPTETQKQRDRFELLCRAYIDARYKKDYRISNDDLAWLAQRVEMLRDLVKIVCEVRMEK